MKALRKILSVFLSAAMLLPVGCTSKDDQSSSGEGKLSVYTSFYAMSDFAGKIGGEKIKLVNLVPAGAEPHDWEPTTTDIAGLENADVFIYSGAGFEHWVDSVLASLGNDELVVVEASKDVELLSGEEHDHDENEAHEEHDHGEYDPHVWLSPINAKVQMQAIEGALSKADPENEQYYKDNLEKYLAQLDELDKEFSDTLSKLAKKDVIVAHQAFGYLCHEYGLNQVAIEGLSPDSEPTPARMAEIIDFAKEYDIKVIFFEELVDPKVAKTIANQLEGATTMVLNPLEGLTSEQLKSGEDYFSIMRKNLSALEIALK